MLSIAQRGATESTAVATVRKSYRFGGARSSVAPRDSLSDPTTLGSAPAAVNAIQRYGEAAELELAAHPPMLRHGCGFALTDQGADTRFT